MEVWKIVFHSILEIFHSIPFWHLPYSILKFPFHSIPCPADECCDVISFYCLILLFAFSASVNCTHVFSVSICGCSSSVSSALLLYPQCTSLCALNNKLTYHYYYLSCLKNSVWSSICAISENTETIRKTNQLITKRFTNFAYHYLIQLN